MSVMMKMMETVAKVLPDGDADGLLDARGLIGRPIDRLDAPQKVTGTARFAAEVELPNMVHAALVYSDIAHGTISAIDSRRAEAAPGVIAVITHLNAPKMKPPPLFDVSSPGDAAGTSVPVLNTDEVSWNGQPVAIVVADTSDRAEQAAALIEVTWRAGAAALSFQAAKAGAKKPKSILMEDAEVSHGDAEGALRSAAVAVDAEYQTPFYNHNAIEPHAAMAYWERDAGGDDRLTLHSASQHLQGEASTVAQIFGLKPAAVRVLSPYVGGGFGGKGFTWSHVWLCALAAKVVQRPVRLALSRAGVFRIVGGRTRTEQRVALGATAAGKLVSLIHTGVAANSPDNEWPEQFTFPARHLYAMENHLISQSIARLHMTANTAMRAPGESIGSFALESAMDELAWALELDPIKLRLRNEPDRDPVKHTPFSSRHLVEAYRIGAERFGWNPKRPAAGTQRTGDWLIGHGMATAFYPYYRLPAAVNLRIDVDGSATVRTSAQEMGMGTSTVQTQHIAQRLGLPMDRVRFEYGDSHLPPGGQAGGSSQTASLALAIRQAFDKLQAELLTLARRQAGSALAGARAGDVEARDAGLFLKGDESAGERYVDILQQADKPFLEVEVTTGPPLESMKYSMQSYGAQFCEVRVHAHTGEVRVSRWVGAFDTGRILNPKTANSQFRGGIVMGIGMALTEETLFDERSGRIANPSLAEYHVPVHADVPEIDVLFTDIADPHTPLGAHGVGEIGITGTAAAIANAVYHATGKRIRGLPITLDKLMD